MPMPMSPARGARVVGVGVDVIEVSRIAAAMEDPGFVAHILTVLEMQEPQTPGRLAATWAAKEAVAKAVGVHLRWHDVEIRDDEQGERPCIFLPEATKIPLL